MKFQMHTLISAQNKLKSTHSMDTLAAYAAFTRLMCNAFRDMYELTVKENNQLKQEIKELKQAKRNYRWKLKTAEQERDELRVSLGEAQSEIEFIISGTREGNAHFEGEF